jgi:hypothetical protein
MKHHPIALIVDFQFTGEPFSLSGQLSSFPRFHCAFVTSSYGAEAAKFREKWTGN